MDVMGAFLKGHQAGQSEQAHAQALEENKLRMLILKHQIDGLKIEDQIRQRKLAGEQMQLLQGQPDANMPTETVQAPDLQSRSYAGAMTGLPGMVSSMARESLGGGDQSAAPGTMLAPAAQPSAGTHDVTQRQRVKFGAIPEMGLPEVSIEPKSAEDLIRASIAAKLNEPFNLSEGQSRFIGGREIARGGKKTPTTTSLAVDAAAGDEQAEKALALARPGSRATAREANVLLDGEETKLLFDPVSKTYTDLDGQKIENAATRVRPMRASRSGDPDVANKRNYDEFDKNYGRRHQRLTGTALEMAQSQDRMDKATLADKDTKPKDRAEAQQRLSQSPIAAYRPPPSFDKWKVMTPAERAAVLEDPGARITDAEMLKRATAPAKAVSAAVPPEVQAALTGKEPGHYKGKDGRMFDVLEDGRVVPGPTR